MYACCSRYRGDQGGGAREGRERESIVWLKRVESLGLDIGVFLSAGERVRLKSPKRIQGPVTRGARLVSSRRKRSLREWSAGAYTLVTESRSAEEVELRVTVRVKRLSMKSWRMKEELDHAVRIPPRLPEAGTK